MHDKRTKIVESALTSQLKERIYKCFAEHAIASTGTNGLSEEPAVFALHLEGASIGYVVVQMFWGQLHIKYLLVEERYKSQGYGKQLVEYALQYGRNRGCSFAFVETMSFQAPEFYCKLGFQVELERAGYAANTSFYYLKKDL